MFFHKSVSAISGIVTVHVIESPELLDTLPITIPEFVPSENVSAPSSNVFVKSAVPIDVLPLSCDKYALNILASSVFCENSFPGSFGLNMYTPV